MVRVHIEITVQADSDEDADRLIEAGLLTNERVEQIRANAQAQLNRWLAEQGFEAAPL